MIMISNNVIGIYEGGGGRIAAGGGLFAGGLFAGGLFAAGLIAGGLFASGLFASGLNAAPRFLWRISCVPCIISLLILSTYHRGYTLADLFNNVY